MRRALCSLVFILFAGCASPAASSAPIVTAPSPSAPGASAAASAGSSSATGQASSAMAVPLTVRDFTLEPKGVDVSGPVVLAVTNQGPTIHNVTIRDGTGKVLAATKDLKSGEAETLTVDLPTGTYVLFCSLPGHESLGIKGNLSVRR